MIRSLSLPMLSFLALVAVAAPRAAVMADGAGGEALERLRQVDATLRGGTSEGRYRVHIVRPEWERNLVFESLTDREGDRFLLRVLSPRKLDGTVFLKRGDKLSMFLPKLRRTIQISPAMMQDPWMGTDFNNRDLLEASSLVQDYTHRIVSRQAGEVVIESLPRPDAPVSWGSVRQTLGPDGLPLHIEYRDARGQLVRTLSFSDVQEHGGRRIPTRWVMRPADQPRQYTEILIEAIAFDVPVADEQFEPGASRLAREADNG